MGVSNPTPAVTPGGATTNLQYNSSGSFGGDARLTVTAGADNGLNITTVSAGSDPSIAAIGSDTNINMVLSGKGTGSAIARCVSNTGVPLQAQGNGTSQTGNLLRVMQNSGGNSVFTVATTSSVANGLTLTGGAANAGITMDATGTDTNIGFTLRPKGSGSLGALALADPSGTNRLSYNGTGPVIIASTSASNEGLIVRGTSASQTANLLTLQQTVSGNNIFQFATVASATNGFTYTGTSSGTPTMVSAGTDSNIGMTVATKGTGGLTLTSGSAADVTVNVGSGKKIAQVVNSTTSFMPGVLFTATASATVANTGTETSILGTGVGTKTLAASTLIAGKTVRVTVRGHYSTKAAVAGTLDIKVKAGAVTLFSTGAQTMTDNQTTQGFEVYGSFTCRTTGGSGTVFGQGQTRYSAALIPTIAGMVTTATVTVDTTASNAIDVTATWGTADAGNTITGTNVILELLN